MYQGLTTQEVKDRIARGETNVAPPSLTRSIPRIIWDNLFNLFNIINIILAVLVFSLGDYKNALFIGIAVLNTATGCFQEIRSKLLIDKLTIITQAQVTVVRDGKRSEISQDGIVLGDLMVLSLGQQVCADGVAHQVAGLEVDESLITGESKTVTKHEGDTVYSGSFVVAGEAQVEVTAVGGDNYAHKIASNANYEKKSNSQLMGTLNKIIKVVGIIIIPLGLALFASKYFVAHEGYDSAVIGAVTAVGGMIPQGLILLTSVAFSVGAFNLARHNTLTQSTPSIETLARVDTLCLDKTGTITDGTLTVNSIVALNGSDDEVTSALSEFVAVMPNNNVTANALHDRFAGAATTAAWTLEGSVAFSSARKWQANAFAGKGTYVLGAPGFVMPKMSDDLREKANSFATEGFRVLLFAHSDSGLSEEDLPGGLTPVALVVIADHVRDTAQDTFEFFAGQGVDIKVISGDDPQTVSTIAAHAHIENAEKFVDMSTFEEGADLKQVMEENTVFGRVSPYQKRDMLAALKADGHVVGMTGDGVNDVMALREADVGIAMASGSDAARTVSDFVLVDSDFAHMVQVVREGRRVVNNIEKVASLYLVKTIYSALLAIVFIFLPSVFPLEPVQLSLISTFMVGLPSFFLTFEPSFGPVKNQFINQIYTDAVPAALAVVINLVAVQAAGHYMGLSLVQMSTLSVLLIAAVCITLLFRVSRPLTPIKIAMNFFFIVAFALAFAADLTLLPALIGVQVFDLAPVGGQMLYVWVPLALFAPILYWLLTKLILWVRRKYLAAKPA